RQLDETFFAQARKRSALLVRTFQMPTFAVRVLKNRRSGRLILLVRPAPVWKWKNSCRLDRPFGF
ncbi:MAG: hypothetical protein OTJ45_05370, partial [Alphaproteobacteria bacterium]|nr:hypothetical protein [Alphaproteobacteria bacterium]